MEFAAGKNQPGILSLYNGTDFYIQSWTGEVLCLREIYLDNAATTCVDKETAEIALRVMLEEFGNPSSLHSKGIVAERLMREARKKVADALGCDSAEVVFTSGGTEANNLAILGAARALVRRGRSIVTTQVEHSSVLEPVRALERDGWNVHFVPPASDGGIDVGALLEAVDDDTVLVSCMYVNSEVGTILPVRELAAGLRRKKSGTLIHCDAVQAFGKLPFTVRQLGVDLLTVSGHKIHAPKGCGALYIRKGVRLLPIVYGGGQEKGLRCGTESTPLQTAFGHAAEIANENLEETRSRVVTLYEYFMNIAGSFEGLCINSSPDGTPYICNVSLPGYRSETLLHYFASRGIYISSGSACSKGEKSHVLTAMGLSGRVVDSTMRISFCRYNNMDEIDAFFSVLAEAKRDLIRS